MDLERKNSFKKFPPPRKEVEDLKSYSAPLEGRRKLLRLDFNENTIGPSPLVVQALRNIPANQIAIYPEYNGLREAMIQNLNAQRLSNNLNSSHIGLFNGVDGAIHAIFHAYGDRKDQLLTTSPTFGYYNPCAEMQGMQVKAIPYKEKNFLFPVDEFNAFLIENKPRICMICNPNNPTGTRLSPQKIIEWADRSSNTLFVVDELYEAFTSDSLLPQLDFTAFPNIVILRSFSKTAGLAGLRIGFAIGNSQVIERINRVTGPYDINSFAVIAAFQALKDQEYIDTYVKEVLKAKSWMINQLENSGAMYHADGGNYLLIWPNRNPQEITQLLQKDGILIRDMQGKPLIEGSLRVSIGTTEQMKQFWQVFSKYETQ